MKIMLHEKPYGISIRGNHQPIYIFANVISGQFPGRAAEAIVVVKAARLWMRSMTINFFRIELDGKWGENITTSKYLVCSNVTSKIRCLNVS